VLPANEETPMEKHIQRGIHYGKYLKPSPVPPRSSSPFNAAMMMEQEHV